MVARLSTDENWEELFKVMSVYSLGVVRNVYYQCCPLGKTLIPNLFFDPLD